MAKYRCTICGHIYDEKKEQIKFKDLPADWICPLCGVSKSLFELVNENSVEEQDITPSNAVKISDNNPSIVRLLDKCINCGICTQTCIIREGMNFDANSELCVNCGQCIQTCPVRAIVPKQEFSMFKKAKKEGKICIAYTSPAVRVALGEAFSKEYGSFEQDKLVGLLRMLGFDYVFDTTFGADLTIMEEASELVNRIKNNKNLPMFTSCCPAWVKYACQFYPELIENISTCKSPIGMMEAITTEYYIKENNLDRSKIYTVAITPCTAKKYEIKKEQTPKTNLVITVNELIDIIKEQNITYDSIKPSNYDSIFTGSGAGLIFGTTGGVMEAAVRTTYYLLTSKNLPKDKIELTEVRGNNQIKESTIKINNFDLNICVINGISNAKDIIESVKKGTCKYHFIEIMNCSGGCIGGGGQPKIEIYEEEKIKEKRINSLYQKDKSLPIRCSHDNPNIKKIYKELLKKPLSKKAHELLHTNYQNISHLVKS